MSERMSDEKKYLSIEEIETINDTRYADSQAWGGLIRLGSLNAEDMIEFVESNEGPAKKTAGVRLISKSLVDGQGNRIGNTKGIIEILKKKDSATIARLVGEILELNGLDKGVKEAKNDLSGVATTASHTVLH